MEVHSMLRKKTPRRMVNSKEIRTTLSRRKNIYLVRGEGFSDRWKGLERVKLHRVLREPVFLQYRVQEEKM